MAILGFHFSGPYKEKLLRGEKTSTIFDYPAHFVPGQVVQVYASELPNLFDGVEEERVGTATIIKSFILSVSALTDKDAVRCGYSDRKALIGSLRKWYSLDESSSITYVEFKFDKLVF